MKFILIGCSAASSDSGMAWMIQMNVMGPHFGLTKIYLTQYI